MTTFDWRMAGNWRPAEHSLCLRGHSVFTTEFAWVYCALYETRPIAGVTLGLR